MAQQSTAITCNLNRPNPPFKYIQSNFSWRGDAPLQKEICPPHFAAWVHQLGDSVSADEWLQSDSVWIILFLWEQHSAKARSSICAQWGGLDSHRGAWTTPKQKSPTCLQGLLKCTPETGQLKTAGRESWVSCKLQTWKCSCEQPEKKKLSLGDGGLGWGQSLLLQYDLQCRERDLPLLLHGLSTVHLHRSSPLLHTRDREETSEDIKNCLLNFCRKSSLSGDHKFCLAKTELLKHLYRKNDLFWFTEDTSLFFIRFKPPSNVQRPVYIVLPNGAGSIIQFPYKTLSFGRVSQNQHI